MALLPRAYRAALLLQAIAVAAIGAGAGILFFENRRVGAAFSSGVHPSLGVDRLTAFFVLTVAVVGVPALIYAARYLDDSPRAGIVGMLTGLFVGSLLLVVTARDVSTFLAGWELMTLIPAATILVVRHDRHVRHAVFVYLAITHLGGTGVWLCLLALSTTGTIGHPGVLAMQSSMLQAVVWLSAIIGFGTKAGLMPMHSWLPRAHPVAPSHISALMSGVMIKVALYGLIRVLFDWAPGAPVWVGGCLLALGALSSVGGVLYALFEHELKRLLAFHSIENVGIITLGLGACVLFARAGQPIWSSLAFAAALLHTLNHAIFKSLLFLGAGAIERAMHGHEIDHLGGLLRRMPWTAWSFFIGSMAIAGLPPLNGFVSEWLTLQALLHLGINRTPVGWIGPMAAAALAATAAMAVLCFVKVVGLALLGPPRHRNVTDASESPWSMRVAQAALALLCVVLGLVPGLLVPALTSIRLGSASVPLGPGLTVPGTGGLPTLTIGVTLAVLVSVLTLGRRGRVPATAPTWTCGQIVEPSLRWTSSAFTKTLRLSWEVVLRPGREVTVRRSGGIVQSVTYASHVPHLFDTLLYGPTTRVALRVASHFRRLQSGSLRSYALYLAVMVVFLLLLTRIGWLG